MKTPVKAVIAKGEKSFNKEGYLTLKLTGEPLQEVKNFISLRGLGVGAVVVFKIDDKESKSYKQLKTYFLLLSMYDYFFQCNFEGYVRPIDDLEYDMLKKYGVFNIKDNGDGTQDVRYKRLSRYKMGEMSHLVSGLFDEMNRVFMEYGWEDTRFIEMLMAFNSEPIEPSEEIELF